MYEYIIVRSSTSSWWWSCWSWGVGGSCFYILRAGWKCRIYQNHKKVKKKNANILVWKTEKRESDPGDEQCFLRFLQWVCQWVKGYLSWAKTGKSLIEFEHFLTEESYFWYHDKVYILRIITYWREDGDISTVLNFARRTLAMGQNQASVKLLLMNFVKR